MGSVRNDTGRLDITTIDTWTSPHYDAIALRQRHSYLGTPGFFSLCFYFFFLFLFFSLSVFFFLCFFFFWPCVFCSLSVTPSATMLLLCVSSIPILERQVFFPCVFIFIFLCLFFSLGVFFFLRLFIFWPCVSCSLSVTPSATMLLLCVSGIPILERQVFFFLAHFFRRPKKMLIFFGLLFLLALCDGIGYDAIVYCSASMAFQFQKARVFPFSVCVLCFLLALCDSLGYDAIIFALRQRHSYLKTPGLFFAGFLCIFFL